MGRRNRELQAEVESWGTRYGDLVAVLQGEKQERERLEGRESGKEGKDMAEMDTNTEQVFVPVVMPVDLDLMSEIVGLKEFVV